MNTKTSLQAADVFSRAVDWLQRGWNAEQPSIYFVKELFVSPLKILFGPAPVSLRAFVLARCVETLHRDATGGAVP